MKNYNENEVRYWAEKLVSFNINKIDKLAIYGTGVGADLLYDVLKKIGMIDQMVGFIERGECLDNRSKLGLEVYTLSECCEKVNCILVGALDNHSVIRERLMSFLEDNTNCCFRVIDVFGFNSLDDKLGYLQQIEKMILKEKSCDFVEITTNIYCRDKRDTKVIAWYLPQYHEIEINNELLGRGFTEWTNTTRAFPMYTGHYQPHIPYDVGYYNLNNIETYIRQIELAKAYGIYGFSFYYYWFSGKRLMEKPLEKFLEHRELNMQFCITWANENWTTLWDGGNHEIVYEQKINEGDAERFIDDLLPIISDDRYITIEKKPLVIIYRGDIISSDRMSNLITAMRSRAKYHGFSDLYIAITNAGAWDGDANEIGADALVEFPPHGIFERTDRIHKTGYVNPYFVGRIMDTKKFIDDRLYLLKHKTKIYYRAALTSWDNTSRKARSGATVYHGLSPKTFKKWLKDIVHESKQIHCGDSDIVFVNSWNEWAEGSHLEPDMKYGYAYLQAVKDVLEESRKFY